MFVTNVPSMEPTIDVVWPKSPRGVQRHRLADRPNDLDGMRVAFLWDHLFRGDEIFPALEEELRQRFPSVEILGYEVFGNTHGGDEAEMIAGLPNELKRHRVDAVVSAMGC